MAPLHWRAIVGMQRMRVRNAVFGQFRLPDQDACQFRALAHMNLPAHDFRAEDIQYQMEVGSTPALGPAIQMMSHVQTPQGALAQ